MKALRAVFAALFFAALSAVPALAANNGTNVLLIYIDDLNDWVGYMRGEPGGGPPAGATADYTPNIDALAASGVAFTRAYSPAAICTPSRAATLGGRRPGYTGVYDVYHDYRQAYETYNIVPITMQFMANGYDVIGAGKIYHPLQSSSTHFGGAELWDTLTGTVLTGGGFGEENLNGMNLGSFDWGSPTSSDTNGEMLDHTNATTVINAINATRSNPFFIALGINKPHVPWYVPASYFNMFTAANNLRPPIVANDLGDVPAAGVTLAHRHGWQEEPDDVHALVNTLSNNRWNAAIRGYLAATAFADFEVGRVMAALNASPKKNNTIVVLLSDHGWNLGEKEHWHKMALWERTSRIPYIFSGPGIVAGGRSSRPVDTMSLYPTLTALTGVPTPTSGFDGVSIASLLANPAATAPVPYAIDTYWNGVVGSTGKPVHTVRTERYRYIRYADGTEELYDEQNDPNEWTNVAGVAAYAAAKATMQGYLPTGTANNRPPIACYPAGIGVQPAC